MLESRRLGDFTASGYDKGRSKLVQALWFSIMNLIFMKWWCPGALRPVLLRAFGAKIGQRAFIRHRVKVLWPWKLEVGDDCWLGEDAWFLNLERIVIGSNVCISQGVFLCTGSHKAASPSLEYDNGPIFIDDGVWVTAECLILRNVRVGQNAVLGARSVVSRDVPAGGRVRALEKW
jgi:putative colanic acid biosynthesis acetyltransferase WcaF